MTYEINYCYEVYDANISDIPLKNVVWRKGDLNNRIVVLQTHIDFSIPLDVGLFNIVIGNLPAMDTWTEELKETVLQEFLQEHTETEVEIDLLKGDDTDATKVFCESLMCQKKEREIHEGKLKHMEKGTTTTKEHQMEVTNVEEDEIKRFCNSHACKKSQLQHMKSELKSDEVYNGHEEMMEAKETKNQDKNHYSEVKVTEHDEMKLFCDSLKCKESEHLARVRELKETKDTTGTTKTNYEAKEHQEKGATETDHEMKHFCDSLQCKESKHMEHVRELKEIKDTTRTTKVNYEAKGHQEESAAETDNEMKHFCDSLKWKENEHLARVRELKETKDTTKATKTNYEAKEHHEKGATDTNNEMKHFCDSLKCKKSQYERENQKPKEGHKDTKETTEPKKGIEGHQEIKKEWGIKHNANENPKEVTTKETTKVNEPEEKPQYISKDTKKTMPTTDEKNKTKENKQFGDAKEIKKVSASGTTHSGIVLKDPWPMAIIRQKYLLDQMEKIRMTYKQEYYTAYIIRMNKWNKHNGYAPMSWNSSFRW
ncbi:hypothetical protein DMENIID0001_125790 [Sergentomyia squamirostris]